MLVITCSFAFAHIQPFYWKQRGKKTQHSVDKLSHSITILSQEQICQFRTEKQPTQDFGSGQQEVLRGDFEKSSIMIPLQDALPVSILQLCTLVNNSW